MQRKIYIKNKKIPAIKVSRAFSLGEMLMALLVAVLVIVALTPVLTRRFSDKLTVRGPFQNGELIVTPEDGEVTFTVPSGVRELKVNMVGAGGTGASAGRATYYLAENGLDSSVPYYFKHSGFICMPINLGVSNIRITLQGGGGGGGAGNLSSGDPYEHLITSEQNGGAGPLCVKKRNLGDMPNVSNGGLSAVPYATVQNGTAGAPPVSGCWKGSIYDTASAGTNSMTGYGGQNRTVCTYDSISSGCSVFGAGWRLPTQAEVSRWKESSISTLYRAGLVGQTGLDLCDASGGHSLAQCATAMRCSGSYDGNCIPSTYWDSLGGHYSVDAGKLDFGTDSQSYARSARCVNSTAAVTANCGIKTFSGAGGGGGAQMTIVLNQVDVGDRVCFKAGAAGAGGATAGADGSPGGDAGVLYLKKGKTSAADAVAGYNFTAFGGAGGAGATTTANATQRASGGKIFNDGPVKTYKYGFDGEAGSNASGGKGGDAGPNYYGGAGGVNTFSGNINGSDGSTYGAGGGGGFARLTPQADSTVKLDYGAGGNGASGFIILQYDVMHPGTGAGAGGFVKDYIMPVTPGEKLIISAGDPYASQFPSTDAILGNSSVLFGILTGRSSKIIRATAAIGRFAFFARGGDNGSTGGFIQSSGSGTLTSISGLSYGVWVTLHYYGKLGPSLLGGPGGKMYINTANNGAYPTVYPAGQGAAGAVPVGVNHIGGGSGADSAFGTLGGKSGCFDRTSADELAPCIGTAPLKFDRRSKSGGGAGGGGAGCWRGGCETPSVGGEGWVRINW